MNNILVIILFLLMIYIDVKRGIKLFFSIFLNFLLLLVLFYLISLGLNPIIISLIGCLVFSYVILFYVNGKNIKTRASFYSILIVLLVVVLSIFIITKLSRIGGFGYEYYEEINMFSYDVGLDFTNITISLILISLIGAMIDSSVAISSALYEVHLNNSNLNKKELFTSGMNIGKDILCTTTNTLLFAFLSDFMTLVIWFMSGHYSFLDVVNSKSFSCEFIKIMFSATGCVLVIPVTAYVISNILIKDKSK